MPPRTKACAICRKKRIKCDATLPQCLMCIRTGRQCPGPLDGPLIIDMSSTAGLGMKRKLKTKPIQNSFYQTPKELMMVLLPQMSQRAMITEAFYANFLTYFTSDGEGVDLQNRRTWLHQLPGLSSDGSNTALTLALQATASAFCGAETGNMSVVQDAWKLYGQALNTHARLLRSKPKEVTVHMVSTSVMLSIFEAMSATTADAYREHISGAAKMLEVTGPGQCLGGVLCQLFFHIRTQMAFVYLTTRKSQRISVRKILLETLSYEKQHIPTFQRLMSHIGVLAEIYVEKTSPASEQQLIDLAVYSGVKADVDALWLEYKEQAEVRGETVSWTTEDGKTKYRDGFTALAVAYFSTARVLFTILAPRLSVTFPDFTDYYGSILDCAAFLKTHRIGCAYMRMATPLYLVALHSPSLEQRRRAIRNFEEWRRGSMAGISALALQRIHESQDMAIPPGGVEDEDMGMGRYDIPAKVCPLDMFEFQDWVGQM
ncbi:hypothetical protein K505DRAFT_323779 [Melanomma pulvis-pyrius CBS 109.77]|uniref:Zn(2)-C6 fungal-type domain-containing protein n=1 Tax=Melanomma pulvis-pyrius CBS 109.77 TaxID=1314802 RepID=A0A6A6XIG2_9PLEO|nr:hypothetical protein K505DRAFT_323779 [Melanomma pulvis-pyrius CBS 109.77]